MAAKGILSSAIATGILGFATAILFLFCTPDLNTLFALDAPQPFVQIYALALGRGGAVFMTIVAVVGLIMVSTAFRGLGIVWTEFDISEYEYGRCRRLALGLCRRP